MRCIRNRTPPSCCSRSSPFPCSSVRLRRIGASRRHVSCHQSGQFPHRIHRLRSKAGSDTEVDTLPRSVTGSVEDGKGCPKRDSFVRAVEEVCQPRSSVDGVHFKHKPGGSLGIGGKRCDRGPIAFRPPPAEHRGPVNPHRAGDVVGRVAHGLQRGRPPLAAGEGRNRLQSGLAQLSPSPMGVLQGLDGSHFYPPYRPRFSRIPGHKPSPRTA